MTNHVSKADPATARRRAGEMEKLVCRIYEDSVLGKLPDARYMVLDAQYAREQETLAGEIAELKAAAPMEWVGLANNRKARSEGK